uniref:Protein kinase domain-containing protein n=1 Tax=Oreochromis aureus TaxID=47969 RepID=A0AAZ1WYQ9_OREAU
MLGIPYHEAIDIFQNSVEFPQKGQVNTSANPSSSEDDLEITEGTILGDHHVVEAFLGEGGFGLVTRCRDTKNNQTVAIKVNKSDPGILLQAKLEIFVLEQLRRLDPDRCNIVEWNGYFLDGERICLNFELLDQSLWDYIRDRNNQGLPIRELRPILHQLINALFHLGSVGIVHADLKPGNIMVVNRHESPIKVKLIDFGLAFPASALIPGYRVGTVGYCAPEVMLGLPYHEAIDMWSLGLVAVELATGLPLYPGEDYYDVLKFIIETQGQLPDHLLESETRYIKLKCLDHLERLLKRITPSEVLKHPFFDPDLSRRTPGTDMNSTGEKTLCFLSNRPIVWVAKILGELEILVEKKRKTITSTKTTNEYGLKLGHNLTTYHHISPSIRPTTNVFLLSPQPVAADGRPSLSLVLLEVSSCKREFSFPLSPKCLLIGVI